MDVDSDSFQPASRDVGSNIYQIRAWGKFSDTVAKSFIKNIQSNLSNRWGDIVVKLVRPHSAIGLTLLPYQLSLGRP